MTAVDTVTDPYAAQVETDVAARGWYADPLERFRYRFWDGERWTGYAANASVEWDDVEPSNASVAETNVAPVKRGLVTAFGGYFIGLALAFAISAGMSALDHPGGRAATLFVSELGLWSGLVGACVLVSRRRGTGSLRADFDWRFRKADIGFGFAGAIAGRIIAGIVALPMPLFSNHSHDSAPGVFDKVANHPIDWVVLAFIACIGAPLIEELFFRGLMQPRLVELTGTARGLGLTAVLFGAAHLSAWQGSVTFVYAASVAGAGLVFGMIRHVTRRLGPSTWAHFFFNAQAISLAYFVLR